MDLAAKTTHKTTTIPLVTVKVPIISNKLSITTSSLVLPCTDAVFGGKAIELAGRVVHPDFQAYGIGSLMLKDFVQHHSADSLTTYTRNPAVLRMIQHVARDIYPKTIVTDLQDIATQMSYAHTDKDGTTYHFNRYDEGGLYQTDDPADKPLIDGGISLKEQFPRLGNIRHALVVAARINMELLS